MFSFGFFGHNLGNLGLMSVEDVQASGQAAMTHQEKYKTSFGIAQNKVVNDWASGQAAMHFIWFLRWMIPNRRSPSPRSYWFRSALEILFSLDERLLHVSVLHVT